MIPQGWVSLLRGILLAAVLAPLAWSASAEAQERYRPIVAKFSGKGALILPPAPALSINGSGTIEFWVAAKWTSDPGYDPGIMAYTGPKGPRFAFVVSSDRQALGVYAGIFYDTVAFDFSDGRLHYVAIETIGDVIDVYIDGELRGSLGFGFAELPAVDFTVGSIGNFSPFIGEIGQIRIWDEPIDPDTLSAYALAPLSGPGATPHPQMEALVGVSAFANPETGGFVFVGEPDEVNITTPATGIDDADALQPPQ